MKGNLLHYIKQLWAVTHSPIKWEVFQTANIFYKINNVLNGNRRINSETVSLCGEGAAFTQETHRILAQAHTQTFLLVG